MNRQYKLLLIVAITSFVVGLCAGLKSRRAAEIKKEVVERVVVQEHVVTQIKTVTKADGTVVRIEKQVADKGEVSVKASKIDIKPIGDKWHVSGSASVGVDMKPFYGLQVERELLGPISVGVRADTRGVLGVVVGISF